MEEANENNRNIEISENGCLTLVKDEYDDTVLIVKFEPQEPIYDYEEEEEEKPVKKTASQISITCPKCDNVFNTKSEYELHYRSAYQQEPIYCCRTCDKQIEQYKAFRIHIYRHLNSANERYKCKLCDKGFMQKSDLKHHETTVHNNVKKEKVIQTSSCKKCDTKFESKELYVKHQNEKHPKAIKKSIECPDCGKILMSSGSLYSHRKIHQENAQFECEECHRKFVQKINYIHHIKKHIGDRPYACQNCDKSFFEKSQLQRHQNFHEKVRNFVCSVCQKSYKTARCLKVHSAIHLDAKKFICGECNKGFLSSAKLKQHSNIHTGLRPYKCKYCERDFTNFPNWLKHIRRRHKVDHRTGEKLDTMPQFMLKKKASTKKPKTTTKGDSEKEVKKPKKDVVYEEKESNLLGVETFSNGGIFFSTEVSNIDLNLVSKDDLIQPIMNDELDKIMPEVGSTFYQGESFGEGLVRKFVEKFDGLMDEHAIDGTQQFIKKDPDAEKTPAQQIYDINTEMSIFPAIISIFNEHEIQYINPSFIHSFDSKQQHVFDQTSETS